MKQQQQQQQQEQEKEKEWNDYFQWNLQHHLPKTLLQHLRWVSDHTNNFDEEYLLETPPTMQSIIDRLRQGRAMKEQQQQSKQQPPNSSTSSSLLSSESATIRKPTMLPVKRPLQKHVLQSLLKQYQSTTHTDTETTTTKNNINNNNGTTDNNNIDSINKFHFMDKATIEWLCEALQGYHPGATKGPIENWYFDSFLSSTEEIIPNLWLGGIVTAHNRQKLLDELQITHVVCVGGRALAFGQESYQPPFIRDDEEEEEGNKESSSSSSPSSDSTSSSKYTITYKIIDVDDTEKAADAQTLGNCFPEAVEFIHQALTTTNTNTTTPNTNKVYVHCMAGVSRSASVLCAYLLYKYFPTMTVSQSIQLVRSARPVATPNAAFVLELERWHQHLVSTSSSSSSSSN